MQLLKGIRTSPVTSDAAHLPLFRGEEGAAAHQDVPAQTDLSQRAQGGNAIFFSASNIGKVDRNEGKIVERRRKKIRLRVGDSKISDQGSRSVP